MGRTQGTAAGNIRYRNAPSRRGRSVFISYTTHAEADLVARDQLLKILGPMCRLRTQRGDPWDVWVDKDKLRAGDVWRHELDMALDEASLFIVVMSQEYLNSKFCMDDELPGMLSRRFDGRARVIGVWLDGVDTELFSVKVAGAGLMCLDALQCVPHGPQESGLLPVRKWLDSQDAWHAVAEEIKRGWPASSEAVSAPDSEDLPELKLPYWCDRYAQARHLRRHLRQSAVGHRPLVLVHSAHDGDVPQEWVQRLALSEIDEAIPAGDRRETLGFGTAHYFGWPRDLRDVEDALHELSDELGRAVLGGATHRKALHTWQARQPVLWWTHIPARQEGSSLAHAVDALALLLSGWPKRQRGAMVVIVLNVVASRTGEDAEPVKHLLVERLAAAGGSAGNFQVVDLGTLERITDQDVIDWTNHPRFGPRLKAMGADPLALRKSVGDGVTMQEFVALFDRWSRGTLR